MCVADYQSTDSAVHTSYERGRPRPLTLGATSKVILAQLPPRRLIKLLEKTSGDANYPQSESKFRDELMDIRKRGYSVTRGEVDDAVVGIAAPVTVPQRDLKASLSLVVPAATLDDALERRLILLVMASANLLSEELTLLSDTPRESTGAVT
jgi:DNA-binding IclR family transcriptional regulator